MEDSTLGGMEGSGKASSHPQGIPALNSGNSVKLCAQTLVEPLKGPAKLWTKGTWKNEKYGDGSKPTLAHYVTKHRSTSRASDCG